GIWTARPAMVTVGAALPWLEHELPSPGVATVEIGDRGLDLVLTGESSILFTDGTSGSTSADWRVVNAELDGEAIRLDLNYAVNPPAAFSAWATCPRPPHGNHIPVPVRAGEQRVEQTERSPLSRRRGGRRRHGDVGPWRCLSEARGAEGAGFEPAVRGYRTMVFKTTSFGRSDNPPGAVMHPGSLPGAGTRPETAHSRPRRTALSTSTTAKTSNPAPTGTSQPTAPTGPEAKAVCMNGTYTKAACSASMIAMHSQEIGLVVSSCLRRLEMRVNR